MKSRNGMGPVVATALLLIVSVVAVVTFQGWYGTYSSQTYVMTESKSDIKTSRIETVAGDKLYFYNDNENLTLKTVKVNEVNCEINKNVVNGMNEIDLDNCDSEISVVGKTDVLVETDKNLYQDVIYARSEVQTTQTYINGTQVAKLLASDGVAADEFGRGVAMGDGFIVAAALFGDSTVNDTGALYIYEEQSENNWVQTQKLVTSDGEVSDWLGRSTSVYEDTIVVSAKGDDDAGSASGAVYVFERNSSGEFEELQKLVASDAAAGNQFGSDVEIYGDYIVIGSYKSADLGSSAGAVYIFKKNSSGLFEEFQKIYGDDTDASDIFGESVSIYQNYIAVGATYANAQGAIYVFEKNVSGEFEQVDKLVGDDIQAEDHLGTAVDIYGGTIVASAYLEDEAASNAGAAYVFTRNSGTGVWSQSQKLMASDAVAGDHLGLESIKISSKYILIGARDASSGAGKAYLYSKNSSNQWEEIQIITSDDIESGDQFGVALDIYEDKVVIGASQEDTLGAGSGSMYIFE